MSPETKSHSFEYSFTIFTPTYNRAETLERAYNSLSKQSFTDFEWLIVDDNSDDGTSELVREWQAEAEFPIRFVVQDCPGKHIAYNEGVNRAQGRFFVGLDSDDTLRPNALKRFMELWTEAPTNNRDKIVGVNALCVNQAGTVNGDEFPQSPLIAGYFELRYQHHCQGDGVGFNRTAVLKNYTFPELENCRYVPESYVWSQLAADGYVKYCVNEVLGTYYTEEHDRTDQLTQSANLRDREAFLMWHQHRLNEHISWFREDPFAFITSAAGYAKHSFATQTPLRQQFNGLNNTLGRVLWLATLPAGYVDYRRQLTDLLS